MDILAAPLSEQPDLLDEVASIGKDAAEETAKIAATEGQEPAAGGALGFPKEPEKTLRSTSGTGVVVEEKIPLQTMGPFPHLVPRQKSCHHLGATWRWCLRSPDSEPPARQWR